MAGEAIRLNDMGIDGSGYYKLRNRLDASAIVINRKTFGRLSSARDFAVKKARVQQNSKSESNPFTAPEVEHDLLP